MTILGLQRVVVGSPGIAEHIKLTGNDVPIRAVVVIMSHQLATACTHVREGHDIRFAQTLLHCNIPLVSPWQNMIGIYHRQERGRRRSSERWCSSTSDAQRKRGVENNLRLTAGERAGSICHLRISEIVKNSSSYPNDKVRTR